MTFLGFKSEDRLEKNDIAKQSRLIMRRAIGYSLLQPQPAEQ